MATIARGLGLDVESIHDHDRQGWPDDAQLDAAGREGKGFVTYNRDDYILLTRQFFHEQRTHAGVLIIPRSFRRDHPAEVAHALDA